MRGADGGSPGVTAIRDRVIALVTEFAPEPLTSPVDDSDTFIDDLGYHSLALVELSFAIEDAFALEPLTADDVEDVATVGDLVAFISARVSAS